jgi:hypothetical protein
MNKMNLDYYIHPSDTREIIAKRIDTVIDILEKGIANHV